MKFQETEIIDFLKENLQNSIGRHLYAVLGSYQQLEHFSKHALSVSNFGSQVVYPGITLLNQALLNEMDAETLTNLMNNEPKRPINTQKELNQVFDHFLRVYFQGQNFLVLDHCELLFAYNLDLSQLRKWATNQNHILVLLPGEVRGNKISLFHEASPENIVQFQNQLFAENNVWEISNE